MSAIRWVNSAWVWWRSELSDLLPRSAVRQWPRAGSAVLSLASDCASWIPFGGRQSDSIVANSPDELALLLGGRAVERRKERRIRIDLAPEVALMRNFELPVTAAARIDDVVRLELAQATPFASDDIVIGWHKERHASRLVLRIAIVKRERLLPWVECVERLGLRVLSVTIRDEDISVPLRLRAASRSRAGAWALGLGAMMVAMGVSYGLALRDAQQTALDRLDGELAVLAGNASELRSSMLRGPTVETAVDILSARRRALSPVVAVWAEIAHRLPSTAWLTELEVTSTDVTMTGQSSAAIADLLHTFEASPLFDHASFPVQVTATAEGARFILRVRRSAAAESPAFGSGRR